MKGEMVLVPNDLLEGLMDAASGERYSSEEDEVGDFVCCGEVSYREHSDNCVYRKMKEYLEGLKVSNTKSGVESDE
jgi:hypothetical protein